MGRLTIQAPQGKLAVYRSGANEGLPIVFLHADAGSATQWADVMHVIGALHPVVAFDFRGHGDSDPAANGDYSFEGRAADLASVANALSLKRFAIVAHSAGTAVALNYASAHADRVAGILMVDPPTDPRALAPEVRDKYVNDLAGPHSLEVLRTFYTGIAGNNEQTRERVLTDVDRLAPNARVGIGRALAEWNPEPTLTAFRGSMLVLTSPPNDNAAALYRLRPDIPHRVVTHSGHWLQLDQPTVVENAITEFVTPL